MVRPRTVTDETLLDAAAAAVAAVGPTALTLAEIGSRVGLSPATLVQRFGSKRGLLLALARHSADALPNQLRLAAGAPAPAAALIDSLTSLADSITTSAQFANHLAFLLLDLTDPDFQEVSRIYARGVETAIADVLDAGRAAGELVGESHQWTTLPRAVHSAYNGALVTWGMTNDGLPGQHVRDQLNQLLAPHRRAMN